MSHLTKRHRQVIHRLRLTPDQEDYDPSMSYDPDERFSIDADDPIEGLRHLLSIKVDPEDLDEEEQVEDETET